MHLPTGTPEEKGHVDSESDLTNLTSLCDAEPSHGDSKWTLSTGSTACQNWITDQIREDCSMGKVTGRQVFGAVEHTILLPGMLPQDQLGAVSNVRRDDGSPTKGMIL